MTILGTNQQLNQFKQSAVRGSLDQLYNFNVIPAKILNDVDSQKTSAGDMVVFRDGAEFVPVVREIAATDTQAALAGLLKGFVVKNLKLGELSNESEETIGIACEGSVMRMVAEQPIASGSQVFYDARNAATAGQLIASNLKLADFTSIDSGSLTLVIDGSQVALNSLDFSSASTLAAVATVLNTALSTKGSAQAVGNNIVISSATTGANSSVVFAPATLTGSVALALNASTAQVVSGQPEGGNTGKVLAGVEAAAGLVPCGVALDSANNVNDLIRVYIKF